MLFDIMVKLMISYDTWIHYDIMISLYDIIYKNILWYHSTYEDMTLGQTSKS